MVIHSVMPANSIFPPEENSKRQCVPFAKGYLECTCGEDGGFVVERVISTDPSAYLDNRCTPGQKLPRGVEPKQWEELT